MSDRITDRVLVVTVGDRLAQPYRLWRHIIANRAIGAVRVRAKIRASHASTMRRSA